VDGIFRVAGGFFGMLGLLALSALALVLIGVVVVYMSALFPLAGQWRRRFRDWRRRK
jgi:uncharacterized membrane protein